MLQVSLQEAPYRYIDLLKVYVKVSEQHDLLYKAVYLQLDPFCTPHQELGREAREDLDRGLLLQPVLLLQVRRETRLDQAGQHQVREEGYCEQENHREHPYKFHAQPF